MNTPGSFRHLKIAFILVLSVLALGTIGYMLIENLSLGDALYTTIGMMATAGNVVHPLSEAGRLFTIAVIVLGVGSLLYTFGAGMEFIIEGHLNQAIRRHMMDKKIAALRDHYIICGFGRVGSQIAEDLTAARKPLVVIDDREATAQNCIQRGYLAVLGDATSDDILRAAGIQQAKGVLIATEDDAHNISITLSARHLNGTLYIVSRANHTETEAKLTLAGANSVLSPYTIAGHRMANLALQEGKPL
ncbi:MAG: potassium channel family protein [Ktedonobacteraceae bacterium]|nr:potassium channel family protein [Ktedonobacteraceae bacterium]